MDPEVSTAIGTWAYVGLTFIILIVLAVAGNVAKRQLRLMRRDSMRTLVKNLMEQWMSDKLVDAREKLDKVFKEGLGPTDKAQESEGGFLQQKLDELEKTRSSLHRELLRIPHYFEMVSTLVEGDKDAIQEVVTLLRDTIIRFYVMYQPWIKQKRDAGMEELYIEFEKLYNHAKATMPRIKQASLRQ